MSDACSPGFIPPHGNYRELLSYRKAEIVYDLTYRFCHRFLAKTDRTIDQMIQAARSGKQNIVESSDPHVTYEDYRGFCETRPLQVVANIAICLALVVEPDCWSLAWVNICLW